jgi:hypothetical protein
VPGIYLRHLAEHIGRRGVDVGRWLSRGGLREGQLDEPSFAVSLPVFERLILGALELTREPALGLFVGEGLVLGSHGILGFAAMSSGTVREAMELLVRFAELRLAALSISAEVTEAEVRVRFEERHPLGEIRRALLEAALLSVKNILDAISRGQCRVGAVSFPFEAPGYAAVARELFGCEVRWGAGWAGFTLPPQSLDVPLALPPGAVLGTHRRGVARGAALEGLLLAGVADGDRRGVVPRGRGVPGGARGPVARRGARRRPRRRPPRRARRAVAAAVGRPTSGDRGHRRAHEP